MLRSLLMLAAPGALLLGMVIRLPAEEPFRIQDDDEGQVEMAVQGRDYQVPTRPAESQPTAFQPAEDPPVLPPTEVVGNLVPGSDGGEGEGSVFPSLSDQTYGSGSPFDFGGLNSVIKGDQSLFDQSNFGSIIDLETIREKHSSDMFRALQYDTGVLIQQTGRGQASPFIRGLTGQQVLILVDGIRMNNSVLRAGPNQYFNTVDPGQVERIEVMRNGGSTLYGSDAIGGVINIVTRSASPFGGDYRGGSFRQYYSTADSAPYSRANVEGWVGRSGVFAGASYMDVHNVDIGGNGRGRQPFTDYEQFAGDVKYNYMLSESQYLTFALSHFEQQDLARSDRFEPFVFNRPGNTARPTFFDPQQRDLAYLRWQGYVDSDNLLYDTFSTTFSYQRTKEASQEFTNFSVPLNDYTRRQEGVFDDDMVGYQLTLAKDLRDEGLGVVTYGVDYYHEDIDASRQRFSVQTGAPLPASQQAAGPQYPDDAIADRAGAYVNWNVDITQNLNAVVGTRYENSDLSGTPRFTFPGNVQQDVFFERTYQGWVGSIGLNYKLTDDTALVGGVYEGYRAPTIDDLTANNTFQQNASQSPQLLALNLQPEHSNTYEVGMKHDGERYHIQIFEWWTTINDFITRDVVNNNVILGNHQAYLNGTELSGEYLVSQNWAAYGNFAYTFGRDDTLQQPISRIPPTQGVLGLRWRGDSRRTYFDLFTWLVNRQDRNNPVGATDSRFFVNGVFATPGYGTLNMRTGTTYGEYDQHRVSLVLENMTNTYYRVHGSGVDGTGFNAIFAYEYQR